MDSAAAVTRTQLFEVSPAGTTIPLTGGGTSFDTGSTGTGTSFVSNSATTAAIAEGSFSGLITIPATSAANYRGWTGWASGVVQMRMYVYLTAYPGTAFTLWENFNTSATTVSRIRMNTDGTL